jgi:hypothetical protein
MRPRRRQAQRPRERRLHAPPPHVLRDAGQLLLRRLLQGRGHRLRLGPGHQGLRPAEGPLYVTVFREDDEAEELWQKVAGVPKSRIFRSTRRTTSGRWARPAPAARARRSTTTWARQAAEPGANTSSFPLDGGGRFVEIWNLVFMQFDRDEGKLTPLPRPSIDTGMGWSASRPCCRASCRTSRRPARADRRRRRLLFGTTSRRKRAHDAALRIAPITPAPRRF